MRPPTTHRPGPAAPPTAAVAELARLLAGRRTAVLTGAGCSTDSGIPDYRDPDGRWRHRKPIEYREFVGSAHARRRYWAGSLVGWRRMAGARPNAAHRALAALERRGTVDWLITQNVDGLHQRAGSRRVTDLHGRLDRVVCLDCGTRYPRRAFQGELERRNPGLAGGEAPAGATARPDGDARVPEEALDGFRVPACHRCDGTLKPDVVFFGEAVPRRRVSRAMAAVDRADALLVVGSSLMVFSGLRFVRRAAERGIPAAAVNLGRTRGDDLLALKVEAPCGEVLPGLVEALGVG